MAFLFVLAGLACSLLGVRSRLNAPGKEPITIYINRSREPTTIDGDEAYALRKWGGAALVVVGALIVYLSVPFLSL